VIVLSTLARFRWTFLIWVVLLPSAPVAGSVLVQEIGEVSSAIAKVFASEEVVLAPFSTRMDPRTTPILVAPGIVFLTRNADPVNGLRASEARAIQLAYEAGQPIVLLDASMHDIEGLHRLVADGVAPESSTDSVVLAYALRKENNTPSARLVTYPVKEDLDDNRSRKERDSDTLATIRAVEIVLSELTRPPSPPGTANPNDWMKTSVQSTIITSTDRGDYNTPIQVHALHSCQQNKDYYLVNTGGTWTSTEARYQSASLKAGTLRRRGTTGFLDIDWQNNGANCSGGLPVYKGPLGGGDSRVCRYNDYPLFYEIDILPPSGPKVIQVNAAPAGNQGKSSSYTSGFSFSIGGGVDVSGKGPGGGIHAGVTWDNSVSITVPELVVEAGNMGNQGTFTRFKYCTIGNTDRDCQPTIQMVGSEGACVQFVVGRPQNGQTPNGRLSNMAQTVNWQVDPDTYTADTFDITVNFHAELASSESKLWYQFDHRPSSPKGNCNAFGCSCGLDSQTNPVNLSYTFKVPHPSNRCEP
jgi:hypothetical protein